MISSIIEFISPEIIQKQNKIIKELSGLPIVTLIDADKINEAVFNIISNANQATDQGSITVRTRREENDAVIEILDIGCGIKEDDLKNIFNPFFTTKTEGTGLGLAVTHKIIQEHNGKIKVESAWGGGTAFRIYLPLD